MRLSSALNGDAHEARKALILESYLASGRLPDEQQKSLGSTAA